eukprot:6485259-Amphidinium_carterae.1
MRGLCQAGRHPKDVRTGGDGVSLPVRVCEQTHALQLQGQQGVQTSSALSFFGSWQVIFVCVLSLHVVCGCFLSYQAQLDGVCFRRPGKRAGEFALAW